MTVVELLFFLRHRSQRENERARCLEGMLGNASSPTPNKAVLMIFGELLPYLMRM